MTPSADPTVPAEGHEGAAAVVTGAATVGVGAAVAADVDPAEVGDVGVLELPHAARMAPNPIAVTGIHRNWLRVTGDASVNRPRSEPLSGAL